MFLVYCLFLVLCEFNIFYMAYFFDFRNLICNYHEQIFWLLTTQSDRRVFMLFQQTFISFNQICFTEILEKNGDDFS